MAIAVSEIRPVAHLPLVLGILRKLEVMAVIDTLCPPHPDNVVSCGMGVEALVPSQTGRPEALAPGNP